MADTKDVQKKEAEAREGVERTRSAKVYTPDVDIIEHADRIILVADVPGVDDTSLEVTLEKNVLTISGKVTPDIPEQHRLVLSEYGVGDYERSFTVSDEVDRERIQATVKNGVLRLVLPKAEAVKSRRIPVTGA